MKATLHRVLHVEVKDMPESMLEVIRGYILLERGRVLRFRPELPMDALRSMGDVGDDNIDNYLSQLILREYEGSLEGVAEIHIGFDW